MTRLAFQSRDREGLYVYTSRCGKSHRFDNTVASRDREGAKQSRTLESQSFTNPSLPDGRGSLRTTTERKGSENLSRKGAVCV
jgi:hypothetical protein